MSNKNKIGTIAWHDLTVQNAESVKDFYKEVVGWDSSTHDMGDYVDYNIHLPNSDEVVAGVCHQRGSNKNIPSQWLMYVNVESVKESAEQCTANGGKIIDGPRMMGNLAFCVIQDPAGAILAIICEDEEL